jgi:hypothetical protein
LGTSTGKGKDNSAKVQGGRDNRDKYLKLYTDMRITFEGLEAYGIRLLGTLGPSYPLIHTPNNNKYLYKYN